MNKTVNAACILIIIWLVGYLLIVGSSLIVPFIIALFVWHLLNSTHLVLAKLSNYGFRWPPFLINLLSLGIVSMAFAILVRIISTNVNQVIAAAPRYQENFERILGELNRSVHLNTWLNLDSVMQSISVQKILVSFYGMFTSIMGSAVLIAMYVVFLFVEQHFFADKLKALCRQKAHQDLIENILGHIARDTQTYLGIKTLLGFMTAFASFLVMTAVGLDFAAFWALLIFFLNYIPNIGSIIASAFPAALALIQFSTWTPFVVITSGVVMIQFVIGNIIEPKMMGSSLNLSPLVILIALAVWGAMWGILGMFLSVPITVMMMIIFARFEKTRGIAVLLSRDGQIKSTYPAQG